MLDHPAARALSANFSTAEAGHRYLLRCWGHQDCRGCLAGGECSWCPFTWACVPNSHAVPLLAPAYDAYVCPYRAERWELRSRPFGCHVSTTTFLGVLVALVVALILVSWAALSIVACRRWRRHMTKSPAWHQSTSPSEYAACAPPDPPEEQPLLSG